MPGTLDGPGFATRVSPGLILGGVVIPADSLDMSKDSGRITVKRIDPELTATLFANYRSSADALMELVDNALDSRLPAAPMTVDLRYP